MNNNTFTFLLRPAILAILFLIIIFIKNRVSKPKSQDGVQKPGKLQSISMIILIFIAGLFILMAVLGFIMKELEMAIVSSVLALLILGIILYLKYALKTTYEENPEFFILNSKNEEHKVFYENIVDWKSAYNEISILDGSNLNKKYVKVNIVIFKPEIFLRKITEMTFNNKFSTLDENPVKNIKREREIVSFLKSHNYGYLIEDYIEEIKKKK